MPRPIVPQQPRQRPVGEDSPFGLAAWTIVRLVVRVADALNWRPTHWARLAELAVDGHLRAESGHLLWKAVAHLLAEAFDPLAQHLLRRGKEPCNFFVGQIPRQSERRQLCPVQDLVRVSVADAIEESRIRESPLQRVILAPQRRRELLGRGGEDVPTAGGLLAQGVRAPNEMQRRPVLARGLREKQSTVFKVQCRETALAGKLGPPLLPMQSARDHQVENQPEIVIKGEYDPLAQSANLANCLPLDRRERRGQSTGGERAADAGRRGTAAGQAGRPALH